LAEQAVPCPEMEWGK